jgi:hypothetical protein
LALRPKLRRRARQHVDARHAPDRALDVVDRGDPALLEPRDLRRARRGLLDADDAHVLLTYGAHESRSRSGRRWAPTARTNTSAAPLSARRGHFPEMALAASALAAAVPDALRGVSSRAA